MASKPTQRTLEYLRAKSYRCHVVETWNSHACIRVDLFGAIDILALGHDENGRMELLAVQTTSGSNVAARVAKIQSLDAMRLWVESGNRLVVHGWSKKARPWKPDEKRVGVRAKRWELRERWIVREDFQRPSASENSGSAQAEHCLVP